MASAIPLPRPGAPIEEFARQHAARLFSSLRENAAKAASKGDDDSVHDLRVAIRRFTRCVRVFRVYFPKGAVKAVRKRLEQVMNAAAEVRDRDITIELLDEIEVDQTHLHRALLKAEREERRVRLRMELADLEQENHWDQWRGELGIATGEEGSHGEAK